jgi:eukaryotic-like serine/threonine-protein kinase
MPLATGTRVGPYEVPGSLGAGGMGEVYRALDPRLGRSVALGIGSSSCKLVEELKRLVKTP